MTAEASEPHSAAGSGDSMPQISVRPISDADGRWQTKKFLKAFMWPAFFVFLIPVGSFIFFHYAQYHIDADAGNESLSRSARTNASPRRNAGRLPHR